MTLDTVKTRLQLLKTQLAEADTYKNVLALKMEIAALIILFNDFNKSSSEQAQKDMLVIKQDIESLRETFKVKIQNLSPHQIQAEQHYKDVPLRKPNQSPDPYVSSLLDENVCIYHVSGFQVEFDSDVEHLLNSVRPK